MWVQESELGATLERQEMEPLIRSAYDLVVAKLPKSKRPGAAPDARAKSRASTRARTRARTKRR